MSKPKNNLLSVLSIALIMAAGCQKSDETNATATPEAASNIEVSASVEDRLGLGKEVYAKTCASCHEAGADGAPQTGDKTTWATRSPLWMAVLSEHAKSGYLDMPSKGGDEMLTDDGVAAATEYMLLKTFPELPSSE